MLIVVSNYLNIICKQIILSDKTMNPLKPLNTARMYLFLYANDLDSMRADKDLWLKQMALFGLSTCLRDLNMRTVC